jgi:putative endonuclease
MAIYLYILRCSDGSYYVGTRRGDLDERIAQHQAGTFDGYTARRLPVVLVFHQEFDRIEDAISAERQVKGWRREKKEALIRGDLTALPALSRRAVKPPEHASMISFNVPHPEEARSAISKDAHSDCSRDRH